MTTTKKTIKKNVPLETPPAVEKPVETTPQDKQEIKVIERIIESKEIAPADAFGQLNRPQIELIKRTVAKGASDDELRLFIQVCKGANLNPFLKQVFLVPRWDSATGKEVRAIQVSIDGLRAIAEESGGYAGNEDAIFEGESEVTYSDGKKTVKAPNSAKVTVYKLVEGQRYPFTATARWGEYYPGPKMGFQWHIRPYLMLGKCAEALALRKAFPKLLSGMYAQEELDRSSGEQTGAQKIQAGFQKLMDTIKTASEPEILEYKGKMEKSDKYTPEQKAEFSALVEARLKELAEAK